MHWIWLVIVICAAGYGIYWSYPKLPPPGQLILVVVVAIASVAILLSVFGVIPGGLRITG